MAEPFAVLLHRAREAAGLTQQELADRAGLTVNAVSQLERGLRRAPYPHTVRSLADALALADEARQTLIASVPSRSGATKAAPAIAPAPAILTEVIGRESDIAGIVTAFGRARLVTATGPGGVGKTTVALAVASTWADVGRGDVVVVPLAAAGDTETVLRLTARQLGVVETPGTPPTDALLTALAGRGVLLVLDNVEQVPDLGPLLIQLLHGCPGCGS